MRDRKTHRRSWGLFFLVLTGFIISGCGIGDQSKEAVVGKTPLSCNERSVILQKNESAVFHYSFESQLVDVNPTLEIGNSLRYFDWGTMVQNDAQTVTYTAPAFVPETRRMALEAVPKDGRAAEGSCYAHLMDDFTYGVVDDGSTRGLLAASYQQTSPDLTKLDSLSPREKGVIRDFNFSAIPGNFTGVSTLNSPFAMRVTGTIATTSAAYWFRFFAPSGATLTIDGVKRGTAQGSATGVEIPATNSVAPTVPNYASGISLSAGKHTIQIDLVHSNGAGYKLEWTTTRPTATVKPYSVVPPSAFDRD